MATDARLATGLPRHPKMQKLIRRLGQAAGWNWVCLVLWTAESRTNGELVGLSDEDIELAADWDGEPGAFVRALADIRFIDGTPGDYLMHDWADHNPWAAGAEKRSDKARWNAVKRHHGVEEADRMVPEYAAIRTKEAANSKETNASSKPVARNADAASRKADAPSPYPYPSPSPYPSPNEKKTSTPLAGELLPGFARFWSAWPKNDRKAARGKCHDAWRRAGAEAQADAIVAHVEQLKRSPGWTKSSGEFVPAPLVYLNQRRWEGIDGIEADASAWWRAAGFDDAYEANNAGCYERNATQFHDGRRIPEAA